MSEQHTSPVDALAGKLFLTFIESELSEAEVVGALAISATMRLAYDAATFEELITKMDNLAEVFKSYARANLEAFTNAKRSQVEVANAEG